MSELIQTKYERSSASFHSPSELLIFGKYSPIGFTATRTPFTAPGELFAVLLQNSSDSMY